MEHRAKDQWCPYQAFAKVDQAREQAAREQMKVWQTCLPLDICGSCTQHVQPVCLRRPTSTCHEGFVYSANNARMQLVGKLNQLVSERSLGITCSSRKSKSSTQDCSFLTLKWVKNSAERALLEGQPSCTYVRTWDNVRSAAVAVWSSALVIQEATKEMIFSSRSSASNSWRGRCDKASAMTLLAPLQYRTLKL